MSFRMHNKDIKYKKIILILLLVLLLLVIGATKIMRGKVKRAPQSLITGTIPVTTGVTRTISDTLEVHFIDVGQGDCTLLVCGGKTMLIDCGPEDSGTKIQLYLKKNNIDRIDYLILTHPDSDHIGGADVIITKYDIGKIYMLDVEKDTGTYRNVVEAIDYRNYKWEQPHSGDKFNLGTAEAVVLGPVSEADDSNNSSISLKITNGEKSFIFIGDCEHAGEQELLETGNDLSADVYKVAHHGSADSLNYKFLQAVSPQYAVISCGADNPYGHPHEQTMDYISQLCSGVYRTDLQGTVIIKSDGNKIEIETEKQ